MGEVIALTLRVVELRQNVYRIMVRYSASRVEDTSMVIDIGGVRLTKDSLVDTWQKACSTLGGQSITVSSMVRFCLVRRNGLAVYSVGLGKYVKASELMR